MVLGRMGVPGVAGFGLHMGESGAWGRIGNSNQVLAGGTQDLPAGVTGIARERLIAVRTIELKVGITRRHPVEYAQNRVCKYVLN